jgi:hypothetical protein
LKSNILKINDLREASVMPWAQGVGGSNPLAPTNLSMSCGDVVRVKFPFQVVAAVLHLAQADQVTEEMLHRGWWRSRLLLVVAGVPFYEPSTSFSDQFVGLCFDLVDLNSGGNSDEFCENLFGGPGRSDNRRSYDDRDSSSAS